MKRKNFVLSVAAAAVIGAFPAFAQDSSNTFNVSPNVGVNANVGSGDQSVPSSTTANQASTDIGSSSTMNQDASTAQEAGSTSAGATAQGSASGELSTGSDSEKHGKAKGHDKDKLTGLDRADEVAGEHGQHGRDNAREKQGLN